jgi:MerR family transcriptional regulator, mercuric resistance operon regulatory protein
MPPVTASRAKLDGIPIGELSRLSGVNIETIRYCEKIKMLRPPPRTEGGRRVYGPAEICLLAFIRRGRELGFSLEEIRALLALGAPGKASCADVREIAAHHILMVSAPRSPTSASSKGYSQRQSHNAPEAGCRIALSWTFSTSNVPEQQR